MFKRDVVAALHHNDIIIHDIRCMLHWCLIPVPGGGYPKLMGVAWHNKWENFGLITSAEGLVRELVAYDKMALVRSMHIRVCTDCTHFVWFTYV